MGTIIRYRHHGRLVSVDRMLQGKHRYHCLCWKCEKFKPSNRDKSCHIANALYALCVLTGVNTPVFECPDFGAGDPVALALEATFADEEAVTKTVETGNAN